MKGGTALLEILPAAAPFPALSGSPQTAPRPQAGLDHAVGGSDTCGYLRHRQAQARLAPYCGRIVVITIVLWLKHNPSIHEKAV